MALAFNLIQMQQAHLQPQTSFKLSATGGHQRRIQLTKLSLLLAVNSPVFHVVDSLHFQSSVSTFQFSDSQHPTECHRQSWVTEICGPVVNTTSKNQIEFLVNSAIHLNWSVGKLVADFDRRIRLPFTDSGDYPSDINSSRCGHRPSSQQHSISFSSTSMISNSTTRSVTVITETFS